LIILSHRGHWLDEAEKNTLLAFNRSFSSGFGVETDIRDCNGKLVISHDPANHECLTLEKFLKLYVQYPAKPILALNIKADGLQSSLQTQLKLFDVENYFVFDMAVPDSLSYLRLGMNTYTRQSEYESLPPYYEKAHGIWLDEFDRHWLTDEVIEQHLSLGKAVCIVSPELHNRSFEKEWQHYRDLEQKIGKDKLILCTDFPELAKEFFNA
jgi:glycerophosphoryl diester phosphodiesterase